MKNKVTLLLAIAFALMLAILLSSCGGTKDDSTDTKKESECNHKVEVVPEVLPTCEEEGLTEGEKCSKCGKILVEQKMIPALGHVEEIIPAIAPTCTSNGFGEGLKCSVCEKMLVNRKELFAGGHRYNELGVCTVCGKNE